LSEFSAATSDYANAPLAGAIAIAITIARAENSFTFFIGI